MRSFLFTNYNMNKITQVICLQIILILMMPNGQVFAQPDDTWVAYSHTIAVNQYQGHRFRLQALVKTQLDDDSAAAHLWTRVDNGRRMGFFNNMEHQPIRNRDWRLYSISGSVDSGMLNLCFGAFCSYNGKFAFDDFKVQIEGEKGQWKTIFYDGFEKDKLVFYQGIQLRDLGKNPRFTAHIEKEKDGKYLFIEGRAVPNFGVNNKIGNFDAVNGIKLYYEIYGQGTPLLVLHGNGGSIASASPFYPDLMKNYKVIAVDSRGQGRSGDTEEALTYEQMASDMNELLNQLQFDSVLIYGHSDGAIIGLIMAKNYPQKVKKVLAFSANMQPDSLALFPWFLNFIKPRADSSKEGKLLRLMLDYPNISYAELSKIKAPVLIMSGDRDMVRPEHTLKLFQNIPHSQLSILPGSTHSAPWEKKEIFLDLLNQFFIQPFQTPDTHDRFKG